MIVENFILFYIGMKSPNSGLRCHFKRRHKCDINGKRVKREEKKRKEQQMAGRTRWERTSSTSIDVEKRDPWIPEHTSPHTSQWAGRSPKSALRGRWPARVCSQSDPADAGRCRCHVTGRLTALTPVKPHRVKTNGDLVTLISLASHWAVVVQAQSSSGL